MFTKYPTVQFFIHFPNELFQINIFTILLDVHTIVDVKKIQF